MGDKFKRLDKYMITRRIYEYLDYDESKELSKVDKEFRDLYKTALRTGVIYKFSENDIFTKMGPNGIPLYSIYKDISYSKRRIYYQYLATGSFNNTYWPVTNRRVKFMTKYITYPYYVLIQNEDIDKFRKEWKKVKDNSDYVYTVNYLHPILQENFYFSFKFMFVVFYLFILFMSLIFSVMFVSVLYSDIFMSQMQSLEQMIYYPIYVNIPNEIRIPLYYNKNMHIDYENNIFIDFDKGIEYKFDNITFEYYFEDEINSFYSKKIINNYEK